MNIFMRGAIAAMGLVLMGMASVTVAGGMMEDKGAMTKETMNEHQGMEKSSMKDTMMEEGMEKEMMTKETMDKHQGMEESTMKDTMMDKEMEKTMEEKMHKEQGMTGEMKPKM